MCQNVQDDALVVNVDRGAVEQILLNLATNARDAIGENGTIVVEVSEAAPADPPAPSGEGTEPHGFACVSFRDDGAGMDPTMLSRIFEPFFTTKDPGAGTGLGMPMIHGLMQAQGGTVEVESTRGVGTTVRLYFPIVGDIPNEDALLEEPIENVGGDETILIVEDEPAVQRSAIRVLERRGYSVLCARNGQEAFQLVIERAGDIDLVITDVVMPRMRGGQLARALAERGAEIPILFSSGYVASEIAEIGDLLDAGAGFLKKPWSVNELLAAVRRVLDRRARHSA